MKKIFAILLMLVYGLSSTGATVHLHYCCGKLDDISFSQKTKKACAGNKTISKKDCCDNRHIDLKLKTDQESAAQWVQQLKLPAIPAFLAAPAITFINCQQPVNEYPTGPPLLSSSVPVFIKHCVFRI